ncbi:MAG: hypothetical protein KF678_10405 [Phycisphaeraceae bacterium]|nr:hypothetical protein [Phycisphaeraceae bacterium]
MNTHAKPPSLTNAVAAACLLLLVGRAMGQAEVKFESTTGDDVPGWVAVQIQNPDDPRVQEYARRQKIKRELEKELYKIRYQYIHNIRKTELRQAGIAKIRGYTQPLIYDSLVSIFEKEGADVRKAVLEHLAEQKNDEADTVLAWVAVFGKQKEMRSEAAVVLGRRMKDADLPTAASYRIKSVIAEGLRSRDSESLATAAGLAQQFKLIEAIPMLINAQIQGQTVQTGGGGDDGRSLAWIMVGTQQAFVSDLTPVVGDSAVAFDPTVSVITSGTVLRIVDAAVITYHIEVHNALVGLSSEAWGQPTNRLGWDQAAWRKWYKEEFVPFLSAKEKAAASAGPR